MSLLGDIFGVVVAAPVRILNLPVKALEASVGDASMRNELDDVAEVIEESAKEVVDGKAKGD